MAGPKYHTTRPTWVPIFILPWFLMYYYISDWGERDILLKSNLPSNNTCDDSFGFDLAILNRFNMIWAYLSRKYHRWIGNIFPTPHNPVMNWFFHVQMAPSSAFLLCMCGVNIWNVNDYCLTKCLSASKDSLSSQCVAGLNPLLANSPWNVSQVRRVSFNVISLRGSFMTVLAS